MARPWALLPVAALLVALAAPALAQDYVAVALHSRGRTEIYDADTGDVVTVSGTMTTVTGERAIQAARDRKDSQKEEYRNVGHSTVGSRRNCH